jgi:hypothetical protein
MNESVKNQSDEVIASDSEAIPVASLLAKTTEKIVLTVLSGTFFSIQEKPTGIQWAFRQFRCVWGLRAREPIAAGKPVSMMVMSMSEVLSHFINLYINDSIPRGKSQGEFYRLIEKQYVEM